MQLSKVVYRLYIDYGGYTLDVSGPQMVITIKLTSFAWNVFDFGKKQSAKYSHRITNSVDIANARIRFNNGTVASITSSRVAKDKVRKIKLFQENLYSTIDLLLEQTEIYTITEEPNLIPDVLKTEPFTQNNESKLIAYQKPNLEKYDMLGLEIKNFIASVRGKEEPIVNGIEARNALDVVIKINNMILEDLK